MKISFSTIGCPTWNFEKIVSEAKRLNYDGIEIRGIEGELNLAQTKAFSPAHISESIALLKKSGIEVCCLDTSCRFHDISEKQKFLEEAMEAIDIAEKLDCRYIRVFGNKLTEPEDECLKLISESIDEICEYSSKHNVYVLVESHGDFSTGENLLKLMKMIKSDFSGVLWDLGNAYVEFNEAIETTFDKIKPYIKFLHTKDIKGVFPDAEECIIGQGVIDFKAVFALLKTINYNGWLSLEWEKLWIPKLEEPEIALPIYSEYMRKFDLSNN